MFTGLVEEQGEILSACEVDGGYELVIGAQEVLGDVTFGASIAVEGVCLSVTRFDDAQFAVGLAPETLRRTTLGDLRPGARVNLERAALPTTRLGGHYVQGHVDGVGEIVRIDPDGDALDISIAAPPGILRYVVEKGYVTVDGASLTVTGVDHRQFSLTLIRHSRALITLGSKVVGEKVNLEADIMAKYAEKIIRERNAA